jgi:hypothetical protein
MVGCLTGTRRPLADAGLQKDGKAIGRRGIAALPRKVVFVTRVLIPVRPLPRTDACSHLNHSEAG